MKHIVVLGGYGNFGKRIVENLSQLDEITIYIAGRNLSKAQQCVEQLKATAKSTLKPLVIDIFANDFEDILAQLSPYLVIHTSGPYQGQNYNVAKTCIKLGAHYIDLADDRRFVCDISSLNKDATENNVLVVSGASSVPGLSSAVIDEYIAQFDAIDSLDLSIAPGNKAERGLATVRAILSYTGHPFKVYKDGIWQDIYGWMDSRVNDYKGIVGKRRLANVEVPDLELFPERYNVKDEVKFQAGLELSILHNTMVTMAYLAKKGLVKNWAPLAKTIVSTSNLFLPFGSSAGAMEIKIKGKFEDRPKTLTWTLYAPNGNGPYIPTLSTIILAKKLIQEETLPPGAYPCVGMLKLADFDRYFADLNIYHQVTESSH